MGHVKQWTKEVEIPAHVEENFVLMANRNNMKEFEFSEE